MRQRVISKIPTYVPKPYFAAGIGAIYILKPGQLILEVRNRDVQRL